MTQERKELLLQDLCARLPYGTMTYLQNSIDAFDSEICTLVLEHVINDEYMVKPYLFPLSSMTKEQKKELEGMGWNFDNFEINNVNDCLGTYREYVSHSDCFALIAWLEKNHFDYRGLIKKGLAIDATNLNIY